jgi:hypothetical protein
VESYSTLPLLLLLPLCLHLQGIYGFRGAKTSLLAQVSCGTTSDKAYVSVTSICSSMHHGCLCAAPYGACCTPCLCFWYANLGMLMRRLLLTLLRLLVCCVLSAALHAPVRPRCCHALTVGELPQQGAHSGGGRDRAAAQQVGLL